MMSSTLEFWEIKKKRLKELLGEMKKKKNIRPFDRFGGLVVSMLASGT